jgi:3-deoxy-D-manno-octulosonic-acid transferase
MFVETALSAYRLSFRLARPLLRRLLARRLAAGREEAGRLPERWGRAGQARPAGDLVWLHAASVGETMSVLPLIAALREARPDVPVLLTTVTTTAAKRARDLLPEGVVHQYLPFDDPAAVSRFLEHWRPAAAIFVESELWPTMLLATRRRGIPLALINARISVRSQRGWARIAPLFRRLLASFDLVLAQTPEDAERLRNLARREVGCLGNLKFAGAPLPADAAVLDSLATRLGARPLWLAAATHPGEETVALAVHKTLAAARPDLMTLIAPRHPARGAEVRAEAESAGLSVALRSEGAPPDAGVSVYIADTLGEMGLWYRLAEIAFVGGSLVDRGGQNPLEAARLGCALLFGPHDEKNAAAVEGLAEAGALERVRNAEDMAAAVARLLDDRRLRQRRGEAARNFAAAQNHIVDEVLEALGPLLPKR